MGRFDNPNSNRAGSGNYGQGFLNVLDHQYAREEQGYNRQRQAVADQQNQVVFQLKREALMQEQAKAQRAQLVNEATGLAQQQIPQNPGPVQNEGYMQFIDSELGKQPLTGTERVGAQGQYNDLFKDKKESAGGLYELAFELGNKASIEKTGQHMSPQATLDLIHGLKRTTIAEVGGKRDAVNASDLGYKPAIAGNVQQATDLAKLPNAAPLAEATKTGGETATSNRKLHTAAVDAVPQIKKISNLIDQARNSEALTGFGSTVLKNMQRVVARLGSDAAAGLVSDTEMLDVMMGSEVFPMIKALGVGARGMDTPAEREFMRSVLTGSLALNKETIIQMAEIRLNAAKGTVARYNGMVDNGSLDNFFLNSNIPKARIEVGGEKQPTETNTAPQAAIDALMQNPTPEMQGFFQAKYGYLPESK
jgi:hypothetical protein